MPVTCIVTCRLTWYIDQNEASSPTTLLPPHPWDRMEYVMKVYQRIYVPVRPVEYKRASTPWAMHLAGFETRAQAAPKR